MATERGIGPELVAARRDHVRWKVLMDRYGLGRTRLWMLWRGAVDGEKSVHEHFKAGQKNIYSLLTGRH